MGKLFKWVVNILLILIIAVLVIYLVLRVSNKVKIYNVETGSMENIIHSGDYILLYKDNDYHVNDIVTYQTDNYTVTHRIIKMENGKVTTMGDANNIVDDEVDYNQIEGKVIYSGGILNIIIKFKFAIVAFLIGLYLLSCYFEKDKK